MDMSSEKPQDPSETGGELPQPDERAATEAPEQPTAPEGKDEARRPSPDEALAEMRRSLREEEKSQKKTGGLRATTDRLRQKLFGRKGRKEAAEEATETPSRLDQMVIPESPVSEARAAETAAQAPTPAEAEPAKPQESAFRSMVQKRVTGPLVEDEKVEPIAPEPAPMEQIDESLPGETPATRPGAPGQSILTALHDQGEGGNEELSALRAEALEDYVAEVPEEEDEGHTSLLGRLRRSWRYMRPVERQLLIGALLVVMLAALAGSGFLVVKSLPKPVPTATPTFSAVPIPISVSLPGGWVFPVRTGQVVNGKWNPQGPEWLGGTEVCRWVSLPWSEQLEVVVRTFKGGDEIRLSMSNYDTLVYKVQSIQQVPAGEISKLAPNTPSLLVILAKQDSADRWVVTAKP